MNGDGRRPRLVTDPMSDPSADQITLTGLRVSGRHGVFEWEQEQGQEFLVDAVLELDLSAAAAGDDLAATVDYGALAQRLAAVIAGPPVRLLETLATRLAEVCLAAGPVRAATVTVHKPQAPIAHSFGDVAVTRRLYRTGRGAPP